MKSPTSKAIASVLSLTAIWAAPGSAVLAQDAARSASKVSATGPMQHQFAPAKALLDNTPAVKLKPFTLGASQISVRTSRSDQNLDAGTAQDGPLDAGVDETGGPLKADGNYLLDPFNKALRGNVDASRFRLQASDVAKLLSRFNMRLIVDRSHSMMGRDCPGGLSRWEWCGEQAAGLAKTVGPVSTGGLTIVPFATQYDVFEHATADNIIELFDTMQPQNGTRLYEPMAEQFDTYFADKTPGKKPLLMVVITDGIPVPKIEPALVRQELVNVSKRAKPGEVNVIFCQIGNRDIDGAAYLEDLDVNLANYGAQFDLVETVNFNALQALGLGPALALSLQKYTPAEATSGAPATGESVQAKIAHKGVKAKPASVTSPAPPKTTNARQAHTVRGAAG